MSNNRKTRRDFIKEATLSSAGAGLFFNQSIASASKTEKSDDEKTSSEKMTNCIDAHSHIWTPDIKLFPLAKGQTLKNLNPGSFTAEELMKIARPNGVNRVVLIQHHIFHGFDNSYLIHAAKQYSGTFKIVGMIDDQKPGVAQTMKNLLKQNVTGIRVLPFIRGTENWLLGDGVMEMWTTAAETGQNICCLINPSDLPSVNKMCEKYPDTPVVIDHFARIGGDGQIRKSDLDNLCDLAKHKKVTVKISAYYAFGKKKAPYLDLGDMIKRLCDSFGPERLMWASDCPYQLTGDNTYSASINLIREKLDFLNQNDKEWILQKTAEKVFFSI